MPSWSQTETLPFRRFDPSVQLKSFEGISANTIALWSERNIYPDFVPEELIQFEAPQQSVSIPDTDTWKRQVEFAQTAQEKWRKTMDDWRLRPSRWFMGFGAIPVAGKPAKEFLYRPGGVGDRFIGTRIPW